MLRIAGIFFIIGATTLWGIDKSKRLKNQYEHMKYLHRIICMMQSEIRYSRSFLGEIFYQIGQDVSEPYKSWFLDLNEKTKSYIGGAFEEIWKESIEKHLNVIRFPLNELEALKSLGNQLGFADVQIQIRLLDIYLEHLERTMQEFHEEMHAKIKIYHCLGVMSGILVSVLLI